MQALGGYFSRGVDTFSGSIHPFCGAVDIIVVQQQDGSFKSSPWYVRFGKVLGVLNSKEKIVNVVVNGSEAQFHMFLDKKGEAFFLEECDEGESVFSPPTSGDEAERGARNELRRQDHNCDYESGQMKSVSRIDVDDGEIVAMTASRHFERKSVKKEAGLDKIPRLNSLERAEIAADLLETKWSTDLPASGRRNRSTPRSPIDRDKKNTRTTREKTNKITCDEALGTIDEDINDKTASFFVKLEPSDTARQASQCLTTTHEGVRETHVSETSDNVSDVVERLSDATKIEGHSSAVVIPDHVGNIPVADIANPAFALEHVPHTRGQNLLYTNSINQGAGGEMTSYVYCETFKSSTITFDNAEESKGISSEKNEQVRYDSDVVHETHKFHTNASSIENCVSIDTGSFVSKLFLDEHVAKSIHGSITNCDSAQQHIPCSGLLAKESASSSNVHSRGSDCILEVTRQDIVNEECLWNETRNARKVSTSESQSEMEDRESTFDPQTTSEVVQPVKSGITSRNAIEDSYLLLYDNDDCACNILHSEPTTTNEAQIDTNTLLLGNVDSEEHLSIINTLETSHEDLSDEISTQSSPIYIPESSPNSKKASRLTRSLPNLQSHTHDQGSHHMFDASRHSPHSNSEMSELRVHVEGFSSSIGFALGSCHKKVQDQPTPDVTTANVILESNTTQIDQTCMPTVELSLCKHLLFEGMGAKAVSQAFDSEKIDPGMYSVLGPSITKNSKLIVRIGSRYFPWDEAAPIVMGMVSFGQDQIFDAKGMISVAAQSNHSRAIGSPGGAWNFWPFSFRQSSYMSADYSASSVNKGKESVVALEDNLSLVANMSNRRTVKKHVKLLVPSSEQLASLCLREGQNSVTFGFERAMLGKQQVDARIYLWKWNTRIVISDVDGTITKSDVLGQFMHLVGKDWSHPGVADFFSSIKDNGYQFLYLSARAVSQASLTRQFLFNLKQDGKALPDGPVAISPDGLFPSLYREVIRRAPHEFKISCLEDIKAAFPLDCNPFYAGFGNRNTDEISYLKVGIPKGKIFTINPKGEVVVNNHLDRKSYHSLHSLVNSMFPATLPIEQENFNAWNYWRTPLPDIDC